ncbi:MAG: hypothetical protein WAK96_14650, partial [Desulfobaccales bacterium]
VLHLLLSYGHRLHENHPVVLPEINLVEAAESGSSLILRTHVLADEVLLYMDRIEGQLSFGNYLALSGVKGVQQAHGEGGTGADAGHGRDVAGMNYLDSLINADKFETCPHRGMLDFVDGLRFFSFGIANPKFVIKKWG